MPCLSIAASILAERAELPSLRSLRYLAVDGIFIIEIPCLSSNSAIFAGRAQLRSLRSLRYLSVDGIFHNEDTLPIYSFFDLRRTSRAPLASLAPLPIG